MLSIIICSINPTLLNQLSENIKKTIGVEYEIIAHDNRQTNWGICKVYNYCAEKAKYENLVFCHEDILFHTQNWGQNLNKHLSNKLVGLVGVVGGTYKSKYHSSWWTSAYENLQRQNLFQNNKHFIINPDNLNESQVVAVDGLFLACRKDVWQQNQFDEIKFTKFHFYDLDFSLQIYQNYKVIVIYDILLEHFSWGKYNEDWQDAAEVFTKKWKHKLPASTTNLSNIQKKQIEKDARIFFLSSLLTYNRKIKFIKQYFKFILVYPFSKNHKNFISRFFRLFLQKKSVIK